MLTRIHAILLTHLGILSILALARLAMNLFRSRAHYLIDRLSDAELENLWTLLETAYLDLYVLRAVQEAKRLHKPGDTLTREEALQLLSFLQPAPRTL